MLGAADTFRAAAIEQLTIWSERADVPIVKQAMGSDPAAVAYDSLASALAKDVDVLAYRYGRKVAQQSTLDE